MEIKGEKLIEYEVSLRQNNMSAIFSVAMIFIILAFVLILSIWRGNMEGIVVTIMFVFVLAVVAGLIYFLRKDILYSSGNKWLRAGKYVITKNGIYFSCKDGDSFYDFNNFKSVLVKEAQTFDLLSKTMFVRWRFYGPAGIGFILNDGSGLKISVPFSDFKKVLDILINQTVLKDKLS